MREDELLLGLGLYHSPLALVEEEFGVAYKGTLSAEIASLQPSSCGSYLPVMECRYLGYSGAQPGSGQGRHRRRGSWPEGSVAGAGAGRRRLQALPSALLLPGANAALLLAMYRRRGFDQARGKGVRLKKALREVL